MKSAKWSVAGPMGPARATPGIGGYLLIAVGVAAIAATATGIIVTEGETDTGGFGIFFGVLTFIGTAPALGAVLGILHLICRDRADQRQHVAIFGGAGLILGLGTGIAPVVLVKVVGALTMGALLAGARAALIPAVARARAREMGPSAA